MVSNQSSGNSSSKNSSSTSSDSIKSYELRYQQRRKRNQLCNNIIDNIMRDNPVQLYEEVNSVPRGPRLIYIDRNREEGHARLWADYFDENSTFPSSMFRRRFRMRKHVFTRILNAVTAGNPYFQQRPNASGRLGASPLLKCTAAMRMLAYGTAADSVEDYLRISGSLARSSLHNFVDEVIAQFQNEYLRRPTESDLRRLLYAGEERGFPGMLGSIDCMHWEWKNCPMEWKGQYQGKGQYLSIILEVVASYDLWIWHAFFGTPGRCNDINVLQRSPLFNDIFQGTAPLVRYNVNGNEYNMGYYLTDGIYPKWAAFIQSIGLPRNMKQDLFIKIQEGVRKDVERALGVLQGRFHIIRNQAQARNEVFLGKVMLACIIIHNMIVEDERDTYSLYYDPTEYEEEQPESSHTRRPNMDMNNIDLAEPFQFSTNRIANLSSYMANRAQVRDYNVHQQLKSDLIENVWTKFGQQD